MNALPMDAQMLSSKEECALGMEQSGQKGNAAVTDALMVSSKVEFAVGMAQRFDNVAALKDAQTILGQEDSALGMVQSATYAAEKDAQVKPRMGEYASGTGQRSNCVALKDAKTLS